MRDLKHIIEYEDLLQEANNSLVQQAKQDGKYALGYTCTFMPEALLELPGCFSVRLRAPRSSSPDIATYYMSPRTCSYGRSLMERALEGGFNFLNAVLATETCTVTCRFQEHFQMMDIIKNDGFFCEFTDVPFKKNENSIDHYVKQLEAHVLEPLSRNLGVDVSDEALLEAIRTYNEVAAIIREIGEFRKLDNPTITGYEFQLIQLCSLACPKYLIKPMLEETLEDLRQRKPDPKPNWKIKVVLAGSEQDDPEFTKLIESCGALVVADRHCYGSIPGREEIVVEEGESPLHAIAKHELLVSQCCRFMEQDVMRARKKFLAELVDEYHADGIIIEQMKFCEYWSYERTINTIVLQKDYGIPVCSIEKEYVNNSVGQLRTRFQAYVESVEMKKLQAARKGGK